jgi:hypothetical protein
MKKIMPLLLLLAFFPLATFAGSSWMYIKVCNQLDSYGHKGGPLYHNIEYTVKPISNTSKTEKLNAVLHWSGYICEDAMIFGYDTSPTPPYPMSAELTVKDQQTNVVLWKGIVRKDSDNGDLIFSHQTAVVNDKGDYVFMHYFPGQISFARY